MNIDEMPAGREMDALIAINIFDQELLKEKCSECYGTGCISDPNPDPDEGAACGQIKCPKCRGKQYYLLGYPKPTRDYSTDIAAAWEVVEKLSSEGYFVNVCRFPITNGSNVHIQRVKDQWGNLDNPVQLRAETVPLAICRAALKALEVNEC